MIMIKMNPKRQIPRANDKENFASWIFADFKS